MTSTTHTKQMKLSAFVAIAAVIGGSFLIPNSASAQYYGGGYGFNNSARNSYGNNPYNNQYPTYQHRIRYQDYGTPRRSNRSNNSGCSSFSMSSACF